MSNFQSFDELIDALQGAVIKAHNLTQNQHILAMKDYFDDDGNPYMVKIQLPQKTEQSTSAGVETVLPYRTVEVPAFSLVPQVSLKMHKIKMDFDVKMIGLDQGSVKQEDKIDRNISDSYSGRGLRFRHKESQRLLTNIFAGTDDNNKVHVELEFVSSELPEGVMRVNDMLVRLLP